jgi:hypothetical protein
LNEEQADKRPDHEAIAMSGGEQQLLALYIADPAQVLDQGAVVVTQQ